MSLIFATQLAAIATSVLAAFAIVTAWYARRAFLKQSQEVRAIEQQVQDAQELARQQAELLKVQSSQVELQRQQLDEQREVNARQVEVLDLQARELRASLEGREQASMAMRYQYASTVVVWQDGPRRSGQGRLVAGHVKNTGNRPVRDLSVHWYQNNRPAGDREQLAVLLLPDQQKDFNCPDGGLASTAIVQFRTVGDDWWSAGTDGALVGGLVMGDKPPSPSWNDADS